MSRLFLIRRTQGFGLGLIGLMGVSFVLGVAILAAKAQDPETQSSTPATGSETTDLPARLENSIVVVSFNIRYDNPRDGLDAWPKRREWVAELLNQKAPDLIGLQEVLPQQCDDLRERLTDYEIYSVGRDDGAEKGEAVTILWRKDRFEKIETETFWLSETPDVVGSKGWDAALPRIAGHVTLKDLKTEKIVHLFNTHFDHQGETARRESASLLRRRVLQDAGGDSWIVIGDLNARPDSEVLARLRGIESPAGQDNCVWTDAFAAAEHRIGPDSTWNGFREVVPGNRIDHLLVPDSANVRVFQSDDISRDGRFPSDHLPILGEIEF